MKALFISSDQSIFNAESDTRARMREYANLVGELHILSRAPKNTELVDGPLHLHGMRVSKVRMPFVLARRANGIVKDCVIDVVSAQDPFEHGWAALRAVRGTKAKLHIQVHTDFLTPWFTKAGALRSARVRMPLLNKVRCRIADKVLPEADGIRVVSKRVKESLMARYGARIPEPSVLPIFVSDEVPPKSELPARPFIFTLIAVSRLEAEKRVVDIIDALGRIALRYPSVGLCIVGDGRERARLERRVRKLGLSNKVLFLGSRPHQEAWGLMQSAQAFIQASAYEGYGRTLVEAALARVPVITTDVGIVGEVFAGYDDVLAAPPADPAALATHIMGIIEDQAARRMLILGAEEAARKHLEAFKDYPKPIIEDLIRAASAR